jgi:hypothetical protein
MRLTSAHAHEVEERMLERFSGPRLLRRNRRLHSQSLKCGCGLHQFNGDTSPIALGLVKPFVDTNEWHHQGFDDVKGARPGECPAVLKSFFAMREAEMRRCGLAAIRHSEIIVNLLLGQNGFDCVQGLSMKAEYLIVGHHRGRAHENYPLALGWQAAHS